MGNEPRAFHFTNSIAIFTITAAVVLAAFLVNRFVPKKRPHVRVTVILSLCYLAAFGAWATLALIHADAAARLAREVTELFGAVSMVSIGAIVLFDLALPAIGVELAPIIIDVVVGLGYIASALVTMRRAGFDLSGILATSALLTTITAFSLQSTLSNVVGGVALQLDSSIRVGDWVQLENGKQGRVREIRWRYTVIETRDWDTLIVPNATLLASTIQILGKREGEPVQHRMWVYFNVDFRYSPVDVIQVVNDAMQAAPIDGVSAEPKPHCICFDFAKDNRDSFAYYVVRYWLTDLARDDPTSSRVRERIYAALRRAEIPLAVPGTKVWVEQDDAARREGKQQRELERRMDALSRVELFKSLRKEELCAIAPRLRYAPFAPGETITRQGAVAHWLYVVTSGSAEVRVCFEGAEKVITTIVAPGFFGEMGMMTGEPRSATVVAMTEVECYRLDKEAFGRIISERPEIAAEMSAMLAQRKIELQMVMEDLDAEGQRRRLDDEKHQLLGSIRRFFGLTDDERAA